MTNLITFDGFDDAEIRITEDGRYVENFKFTGKGQRETPVLKPIWIGHGANGLIG